MRQTWLIGAFITGCALFLGGALGPMRAGLSSAVDLPADEVGVESAVLPVSATSAETIESLRRTIEQNPDDSKASAHLGLAYLALSRAEADPSVLPPAEDALQTSLEIQPQDNLEAFVGMASLSNARHDFSTSLIWSRRAIKTNPYNASAYGLLGDALFELGDVRASEAAYQEMVERRPDVASYVRASYALQHRGERRRAIQAMKLALQAAGPNGESAAWVRHQMGDIYATSRDFSRSAEHNRIGIALAPGYVPPTVGLAESFIGRGRLEDALEIMETAVSSLPSLEY